MAFRHASTSHWLWAKSGLLLAALILAFSLVHHTQAFVKATTHQPERFTELYFVNPAALPSSVPSGGSLPIAFTVHNVESRDMTYTYRTAFTAPSGAMTVLNQQRLSLSTGETKQITEKDTLPLFSGRGEISVALLDQPEAIHFWLVSAS